MCTHMVHIQLIILLIIIILINYTIRRYMIVYALFSFDTILATSMFNLMIRYLFEVVPNLSESRAQNHGSCAEFRSSSTSEVGT
jgi:hypothetical protein